MHYFRARKSNLNSILAAYGNNGSAAGVRNLFSLSFQETENNQKIKFPENKKKQI